MGLFAGIMLTWVNVSWIKFIAMILYMSTALSIFVVYLKTTELSGLHRLTVVMAAFWTFSMQFFALMSWPYVGALRFSLILPVVLYFISLLRGISKKDEFGFLTLMILVLILKYFNN